MLHGFFLFVSDEKIGVLLCLFLLFSFALLIFISRFGIIQIRSWRFNVKRAGTNSASLSLYDRHTHTILVHKLINVNLMCGGNASNAHINNIALRKSKCAALKCSWQKQTGFCVTLLRIYTYFLGDRTIHRCAYYMCAHAAHTKSNFDNTVSLWFDFFLWLFFFFYFWRFFGFENRKKTTQMLMALNFQAILSWFLLSLIYKIIQTLRPRLILWSIDGIKARIVTKMKCGRFDHKQLNLVYPNANRFNGSFSFCKTHWRLFVYLLCLAQIDVQYSVDRFNLNDESSIADICICFVYSLSYMMKHGVIISTGSSVIQLFHHSFLLFSRLDLKFAIDWYVQIKCVLQFKYFYDIYFGPKCFHRTQGFSVRFLLKS